MINDNGVSEMLQPLTNEITASMSDHLLWESNLVAILYWHSVSVSRCKSSGVVYTMTNTSVETCIPDNTSVRCTIYDNLVIKCYVVL